MYDLFGNEITVGCTVIHSMSYGWNLGSSSRRLVRAKVTSIYPTSGRVVTSRSSSNAARIVTDHVIVVNPEEGKRLAEIKHYDILGTEITPDSVVVYPNGLGLYVGKVKKLTPKMVAVGGSHRYPAACLVLDPEVALMYLLKKDSK